jgi:hypothetical protein
MEINDSIRKELEAILKSTETTDPLYDQLESVLELKGIEKTSIEKLAYKVLPQDIVRNFIQSGRLALCAHMNSEGCSKGYKDGCLICLDYEPQENPGELGNGYCEFEYGHVAHLVHSITTDGYYRSATTLCGRDVNEGSMAVEIYPSDDMHEDYLFFSDNLCKGCASKYSVSYKKGEK